MHGRRSRYVSPLGMYLFTVFVMFMLLSYMPTPATDLEQAAKVAASGQATAGTKLFKAANAVNAARTALNNGPKGDDDASVERRELLQERVTDAEEALKEANQEMAENPTAPDVAALGTGWAEEVRAKAMSGEWRANTGDKKLDEKLNHKLQNPELAIYKLQQTFYLSLIHISRRGPHP